MYEGILFGIFAWFCLGSVLEKKETDPLHPIQPVMRSFLKGFDSTIVLQVSDAHCLVPIIFKHLVVKLIYQEKTVVEKVINSGRFESEFYGPTGKYDIVLLDTRKNKVIVKKMFKFSGQKSVYHALKPSC